MPNESPEPTEWNLNAAKIAIIGSNMGEAFNCFYTRRYEKSFEHWKIIRMVISNRLSVDEIKDSEKLEESIPKQKTLNNNNKLKLTKKYVRDLEKYSEHVNKLLSKYGLDLTEKGESSLF